MKNILREIPFLRNNLLKARHKYWRSKTIKEWEKYKLLPVPKLQLGAGQNVLDGWFNTDYFPRKDIFFLDVTKPFPFADNIFEFIYSEHHIEHINYNDALYMLTEINRIAKRGALIRIATPDLKKYIQSYASDLMQSDTIKEHVDNWIYSGFYKAASYIPVNDYYDAHFVNDIFLNYSHCFIYDFESLKALLEKAGFINICLKPQQEVSEPALKNIEAHKTPFDIYFTLCVEAQKSLG